MGKSGNRTDANVFLVPDDAHIVRYAELADLLEELGTVGMVARHLGISTATVSRHLAAGGIPTGKAFVGRMGSEIDRLLHEHAGDQETIKELQEELRRRDRDQGN